MGIGSPSCLLYTLSLPAHPGEEREVPFELLLNRDTGCTNFRDYRTLLISHDFVVCHTILSKIYYRILGLYESHDLRYF